MVIKVGDREYTIEFSFEASLYGECTEKVIYFMTTVSGAETREELKEMIKGLSDIPSMTLTMFYGGLMEHHGEDGDGTVLSKKDAKAILREYLEENKDGENGNFYAVMDMLIEQMGKDGFFGRIGLDKMFEEEVKAQKGPKVPQDHKKKSTTTKKTTTKKTSVSVVGEK